MDNQEMQKNTPAENDAHRQLTSFIQHEVHHAVEDVIGNPMMVRKLVGETIRHLGISMTALSASYLPLDSKEFLVQPERIKNSCDALVLSFRPIHGENAFQALATAKKDKDELVLDVTLFRPHLDHLGHSTFYVFPEEFQAEMLRQLQVLIKAEGNSVFQAIVLKDYFQPEVLDSTPAVDPDEVNPDDIKESEDDATVNDDPRVVIGEVIDPDQPVLNTETNTEIGSTHIAPGKAVFKLGDMVTLKSGGPDMTISGTGSQNELECTWYDGGEMRSGSFNPLILKTVNTQ